MWQKILAKIPRSLVFLLLFVLLGFIVFFPVLSNDFIWDDMYQIVRNPFIQSLSNIPVFFTSGTFYLPGYTEPIGLYFRPLMSTTYTIVYHFFQLNPAAYHATSLILHILTGWSIFIFFLALTRKIFKKQSVWIPAVASLIYVFHPMNVEMVAYAANIQDTLYVLFGMWSLYVTIHFRSVVSVLLACLLILLSLFSKETGILFLLLSITYVLLFNANHKWVTTGCGIATFIFYVSWRCVFHELCPSGGDIGGIGSLPFLPYLLQVPYLHAYYISTFLLPLFPKAGEHFIVTHLTIADFYIPLAIMLPWYLILFQSIAHMINHSTKHIARWFIFFVLWTVGAMWFHFHTVPVDFSVADRWFATPMIGLLGMGILIAGTNHLFFRKQLPVITSLLVLATLATLAHFRTYDFKDPKTFYLAESKKVRQSHDIFANLGSIYATEGNYSHARYYIQQSLKYRPDGAVSLTLLGQISEAEKNFVEAERWYRKAVDAHGTPKEGATINPKYLYFYMPAYVGHVRILIKLGYFEKAQQAIVRYSELFPDPSEFRLLEETIPES